MNHRIFRQVPARKRGLTAVLAAAVAASTSLAIAAGAGTAASAAPARATARATAAKPGNLGQLTGLLPRDHLTEESALQVDLSHETVRLPLYPGTANGKKVWYVLLDASDSGLAHDLGVNYAPKLANIAISDPAAVQTVTLDSPTVQQNPFGPAAVHFAGAPDFSPTRIANPGRTGSRWPSSSPVPWPDPGTARSSRSPARTSSTTRRSWLPATAPST